MNLRTGRVFRDGGSSVVVVPRDWLRGQGVEPGDQVEIRYNGELRIRPKKKGVQDGDRLSKPPTA